MKAGGDYNQTPWSEEGISEESEERGHIIRITEARDENNPVIRVAKGKGRKQGGWEMLEGG